MNSISINFELMTDSVEIRLGGAKPIAFQRLIRNGIRSGIFPVPRERSLRTVFTSRSFRLNGR